MTTAYRQPFEVWMEKVDDHIEAASGLTMEDLPDWHYYDAFDDGVSPKSAAEAALYEAGFPL